ncbi:MAG: S9 family peptidase [Candidatus Thorarchaeota archaeon]|nr:MAG: S9 family peptidase [Candidatus Thorarchaeota archaeon]
MKPKPDRVESYLEIETAGGPSWHPRNSSIVYVANAPGSFQIHKTTVEMNIVAEPTIVTFEEDRCTDPRFLSDESIVFTRDRGGNENFQLGSIGMDGELTWLTQDMDAKHRINLATEYGLYYMANIEDKARLDLYRWRIPLSDHEPELIYRPSGSLTAVSAVSPDDSKLVLQHFFGNNHQELALLEPETGNTIELTNELKSSRTCRWSALRFLDNEHLLVASDLNSDTKGLGVLSLACEYSPLEYPMMGLEFSMSTHINDSAKTFVVFNEEGYSSLCMGEFKPSGVDGFRELDLPMKGVITIGDSRSFSKSMDLSENEKQLAITLASATGPSNIWILDLAEGISWKATEVSIAGLDPADFSDATLWDFKSFDDLRVPYFRYLPTGSQPSKGWPAIFMIHGGPESQIRPDFNPVIQFFVSAGYAVVAPNIRGSTGYGRTYLDLDNVEKRLDSIMDIRELAFHIKQNDTEIDGDRLVIYGVSYGGFSVLSAMTEHPDLWKAGVDIVGISNFVTFLQNTASWRRGLREVEYGSLENAFDTLMRISPIHKVDRISAPLFIIQGDNDERVPLSESVQIYEKLKEKGIPVRLLRFADEGHGLAKRKNRVEAYTKVLEWLNEIV